METSEDMAQRQDTLYFKPPEDDPFDLIDTLEKPSRPKMLQEGINLSSALQLFKSVTANKQMIESIIPDIEKQISALMKIATEYFRSNQNSKLMMQRIILNAVTAIQNIQYNDIILNGEFKETIEGM